MNVLITGADGYIGRALARRLALRGAQLQGRPVDQLVLCDLRLDMVPEAPSVQCITGSVAERAVIQAAIECRPDVVFHLASIPSGQSESDYALGLDVNLRASLELVDALRHQGKAPTLVFTSSIAVFGAPLPAQIDDHTPLQPSLSYGAQKQMLEIHLADATRRGFVRARCLRLPGIVARPPTPTGALSAFSSELIRALARRQPYVCPVSPEATLWLQSLTTCIDNLLHAAECPAQRLGSHTAWTLPALRLAIGDLVQAFDTLSPGAAALVSYRPDAALEAQFGRLPPLDTVRADAAGFRHDGSVARLIERAVQAMAA